jgi:hypothetical protein
MIKLLFKYKYQIILIIIGLVWLAFLNELMQIKNQNNICNDCDNYRESASYLYHNFKTHNFRPIGMAIITGIPYLFGATDATIYEFSLIINTIAWLGSALLLFNFLKKQLQISKAVIGSLLFYSIISFVFINFKLLTESIFTFLMITVFYFLEKYYTKKSFHFLSMSISILLFSILIKPSVKFFAIIIFIYFGKTLIKNYRNKSILFIYLSLSLIAFQYVKMKNDYGNYTLSYIDSVTYYNYLGSKAFYYKTNEILNQSTNKRALFLEKHSYPEQRNIATKDLINQISNNKFNLIKAYISDLSENTKTPNSSIEPLKNLNNKSYYSFFKKCLFIISKYQNWFFTIIGFILAVYYLFKSYKNEFLYSLISSYILYTITISGVSCSQGDRFHIVFFPFVIILMAKFNNEKNRNLSSKKS